jgi:asparagine synthase (glutamine-hydrolysing)
MSVQFGTWNFDGSALDAGFLAKARAILAPYGPDGCSEYSAPGIQIFYFPFHTAKESRCETQPLGTSSGALITWDGRLDNRSELLSEFRDSLPCNATDVAIVAAAYERWGTGALAKLIGDWALSISDPRAHTLLLAKDFLGSRHLYYSLDNRRVTWCTVLDPLVLVAKTLDLEEEYLAGWLSRFPATHLTPYVGIRSVPPSSFVRVTIETTSIKRYWEFDRAKTIRYKSDAEYEEHFRALFSESVRCRLRSDAPILAELSGGMDSSSIVCMADVLMTNGQAEVPRLDTVSYFDDCEPNWDERPYVSLVEQKRGREGCHIEIGTQGSSPYELENLQFAVTPGSNGHRNNAAIRLSDCLKSQGNRIVLSGIGGDETTGGVPTPIPELANLLARAQFRLFERSLARWAIAKRKPWLELLFQTVRCFLPPAVGVQQHRRPPSWLEASFVERHRAALEGYPTRYKLFGALPSFQENLRTFETLRRQLACSVPSCDPAFEKRYPYLDRDLLEFLFGIPRDQLVRPHERRSLLRRSLARIVPEGILQRKRKAFVTRRPLMAISDACPRQAMAYGDMAICAFHIVSPERFGLAVARARQGFQTAAVPILRALVIEQWLQQFRRADVVPFSVTALSHFKISREAKHREVEP